jgi:serine/threonine protein kinase
LIDGDGQVARICDFGSSRIDCGCYSGPETQEGTFAWDSPELWYEPPNDSDSEDEKDEDEDEDGEEEEEKARPRTKKSDVWAFGCVALEVCNGRFINMLSLLSTYTQVQMGMTPWDPKHEGDLRKMRMRQFNARLGHPVKESDLELHGHPIMNQVWSMIQSCWEADPSQRPEAAALMILCEAML